MLSFVGEWVMAFQEIEYRVCWKPRPGQCKSCVRISVELLDVWCTRPRLDFRRSVWKPIFVSFTSCAALLSSQFLIWWVWLAAGAGCWSPVISIINIYKEESDFHSASVMYHVFLAQSYNKIEGNLGSCFCAEQENAASKKRRILDTTSTQSWFCFHAELPSTRCS